MNRITLIIFLASGLLLSCQNKTSSEQTATDSLPTDTAAVVTEPSEPEEIQVSEIGDEEPESQLDMDDFDYTYEGLVNDKYKVRVNMFQIRGEQKARLVYLNSKKIINMDFAYPAVGKFELTEKVGDRVTGIWKIGVEEEDILTGTWNSADGSKQMPVQLSMTEGFDDFLPAEEIKSGTYELKLVNEDPESKQEFPLLSFEELHVKNMADNTVFFNLYIQGPPPAVHSGVVNGFARKTGTNYIYTNAEGCELTFSFSQDSVGLEQKGSAFTCGLGANIRAYGKLGKRQP